MLNPIGLVGHFFLIIQGLLVGFVVDLYIQRRNAEQRLKNEVLQRSADLERAQAAERQLDAVLDQSADGIYITENKDNTIILANRAFLKMVGISRDDLIGKQPWDFVPVVDKTYQTTLGEEITIDYQYHENNYIILQQLLTDNVIRNWQYYVINPKGELVPVEANVTNLTNPRGERVGAISVVRDNTGHKLAERELSRANDFLNNVIENSIDCILLSDSTGHITHINQAGLKMLGYTLEEMLAKSIMDFSRLKKAATKPRQVTQSG